MATRVGVARQYAKVGLRPTKWRRGWDYCQAYHCMAVAIEKIGEFDSATEDWGSYLDRLQLYLVANGVADEKKQDTFLCCVGRETFWPFTSAGSTRETDGQGTNRHTDSSFNTQTACDSGSTSAQNRRKRNLLRSTRQVYKSWRLFHNIIVHPY